MGSELAWLALGLALGNRKLLAALEGASPEGFTPGSQRNLFLALWRSHEEVAKLLVGLGAEPGKPAWQAVIDAVRRAGEVEAQRSAAGRISAASRLLSPEQFLDYLRKELSKLEEGRRNDGSTP